MVKNRAANAGDAKDTGSIPGSGRSNGERNGDPCQYSCLGNPMDKGAWWATIYEVAKQSDIIERLNTQRFHKAVKYFLCRRMVR